MFKNFVKKIDKRKIIAGLIIILGVAFLYILIFNPFASKEKEAELPDEQIEQPYIPARGSQKNPLIVTTIEEGDFNFPKKLPIYKIELSDLSLEEASQIARNLGFLSEPFIAKGGTFGTTYLWSTSGNILRVVPSLQLIDYKTDAGLVSKGEFGNEQTLIARAKEFLYENKIISEEQASFEVVDYVSITEHIYLKTDKTTANIADVRFKISLNNLNVVNDTPIIGTVNVKYNKLGEIFSAYIDRTGKLTMDKEYPLKDYEEFLRNLSKAKIQRIGDGGYDAIFFSGQLSIKRIVITDVELAYMQESVSDQDLLQPVFALKGYAVLKDGQEIAALLYLPAITEIYYKPIP